MKKQLIIFSALFAVFASQCSFYERMKAKAASAAQSVKDTATSAYDKFGGMSQSASNKLQSTAGTVRNTIGRESQAFMSGARSVPGQLNAIKEDFVDSYIDPIRGKVSRFFNKLSPTLTKVTFTTITNDGTEETIEQYYNPMTEDAPKL
jgi:hypothetical protein